jgi:predicted DNA-binding transcriptional regulator AlpA
MNAIIFSEEDFTKIINDLSEIKQAVNNKSQQPLADKWLDVQEVCQLLHISKRTLINYRAEGLLPYSQINAKIYFKSSDIESYLEKHYVKARNK